MKQPGDGFFGRATKQIRERKPLGDGDELARGEKLLDWIGEGRFKEAYKSCDSGGFFFGGRLSHFLKSKRFFVKEGFSKGIFRLGF